MRTVVRRSKKSTERKRGKDKFRHFRTKVYECPAHGKFVGFSWLGHRRHCNALTIRKKEEAKMDKGVKCPFCDVSFASANRLNSHRRWCKKNPARSQRPPRPI